ncbi:hypothetical protein RFI_19797 [Reticulomyxa filosa]|uniref:Uncharacterized protein n=1 Tax=Reticulomyxa filosa TaxID=46433 RepID=X6MU67_RETFI|nr:hypothetical protein RFI_19797 [Reticulomyxa filosa]|eukprot:ETO17523.1 hypothetical protein RFI_19797 [Reticulomyxa filosa]
MVPLFEIDVLVPEPELGSNVIKSSSLAFINVLDSLQELSDAKTELANEHINRMKDLAKVCFFFFFFVLCMCDQIIISNICMCVHVRARTRHQKLSNAKSQYQTIEKHGKSADYESSGDVKKDLENSEKEVLELQGELYHLDEEYRPLHAKLRQIHLVESDLDKYRENHFATMSQLRRIHARTAQVLQEHQIQRDSAWTALQATEVQQAIMKSKISDKIAETMVKIDHVREQLVELKGEHDGSASSSSSYLALLFSKTQKDEATEHSRKSAKELELEDELNMCNNFLAGLNQFLQGLKKLSKEQRGRVVHLEQVIDQLQRQRAVVTDQIAACEKQGIDKLQQIRHQFIAPLQEQLLFLHKNQHAKNQFTIL